MKKHNSKKNSSFLSRRDFLIRSAVGMAGIVFVPREKLFAAGQRKFFLAPMHPDTVFT